MEYAGDTEAGDAALATTPSQSPKTFSSCCASTDQVARSSPASHSIFHAVASNAASFSHTSSSCIGHFPVEFTGVPAKYNPGELGFGIRGAISSSTMATEACCTPAPPATVGHVGKEEMLAGTKVYTTGSASASAAVILIADLFGYETPLLRKLADKVAAAGYLVLVPDLLEGDPFTGNFSAGDLEPWLAKHPATGAPVEVARSMVEAVKDKGVPAVGAAGFCWGAKVVACLGKDKDVRAVVQLHPSLLEASDYEQVVVPIAVLAAPTDGIEKYEEVLASRSDVKSFVKVFSGVQHGWTVRYDETDEDAVEKANEAHKLMLDWFAKYL